HLEAYLCYFGLPSAVSHLPAVPQQRFSATSGLASAPIDPRSAFPGTPSFAGAELNRSTLSSPHHKRPDNPPSDAIESPAGHHGPIVPREIHGYIPRIPLRISVPRSERPPSGPPDPVVSECPAAAIFHLPSRSIPDAPVAADKS